MLQNATPLRKSAPGPPNISDEHVSCAAPAMRNASLQILLMCHMPAIVFGHFRKPSPFTHFWQGAESLAPATRNDIRTSKSGPSMLTWKCASRHNGVHFFDISTSKKCSWTRQFFTLLTSKCASRRNGVHFFISHLASWLRTRRFKTSASLLFDPPSQKSLEKHSVSRLSYLFAHLDLLSSETFSFLFFFLLLFLSSPLLSSSLLFSSLTFPHLCFSSVYIVGSLTSKLLSNILALVLVEDEFTWFYLVWLKVNQSWAGDAIMEMVHTSQPEALFYHRRRDDQSEAWVSRAMANSGTTAYSEWCDALRCALFT